MRKAVLFAAAFAAGFAITYLLQLGAAVIDVLGALDQEAHE